MDHIWERYLYRKHYPCEHTCGECTEACCALRKLFIEKHVLKKDIGAEKLASVATLMGAEPPSANSSVTAEMQLLRSRRASLGAERTGR